MKYQFAVYAALLIASACSRNNGNELPVYTVDGARSTIEWKGSAPDHFHTGSFSVSGEMQGDSNGHIRKGTFNIPIASIQNFDLPNEVKPQLLDHLKSPDFFNMAVHPNARFVIHAVTPAEKPTPAATHIIEGDFTMLGNTRAIRFPAKITSQHNSIVAKASFSIDRLLWGMTSYNDPEKELYIRPEVEIKLNIQATKK